VVIGVAPASVAASSLPGSLHTPQEPSTSFDRHYHHHHHRRRRRRRRRRYHHHRHLFDPRHIGIILGDGELHIPQQIWCLHLSVRPQIWCLHLSVSTGTWCLHLSLDFSWSVYYKSTPAWSCFLCPTLYYLRLKCQSTWCAESICLVKCSPPVSVVCHVLS